MKSHPLVRDVGYAIGGLGLLLVVYVGGYFGLVTRRNAVKSHLITEMVPYQYTVEIPVEKDGVTTFASESRQKMKTVTKTFDEELNRVVANFVFADTVGPNLLSAFFSPIHELDRRIRPEYWKDQRLRNDLLDSLGLTE